MLKTIVMFYIIISTKERFEGAVKLIVDDCRQADITTRVISIEKLTAKEITSISSRNKIFFLTNERGVTELIKNLSDKGAYVINNDFLKGNRSKFYVQKTIKDVGVLVPKHVTIHDVKTLKNACSILKFPLFLKSVEHVHKIFNGKNETEIINFWQTTNKSLGWYLEESIEGENTVLEKYYCVSDKFFNMNGTKIAASVTGTLNLISNTLKLEAFSAEFIFDGNSYYCIDINPAPAFFRSAIAREYFVRSLKIP